MAYEGWTNWETWNVAALIDNERETQDTAHNLAKRVLQSRDIDKLADQFSRYFRKQEREVRKYHADSAADARDARGKYEREQLEGKGQPTPEEIKAMSKEERVKYYADRFGGMFYDMGGTSNWEKPFEPVNWKEIATYYFDEEARAAGLPTAEESADAKVLSEMGIKASSLKKKAGIFMDACDYFYKSKKDKHSGLGPVFQETWQRTGQGDDKYIAISQLMYDLGSFETAMEYRDDVEQQLRDIVGDDPNYSEKDLDLNYNDTKELKSMGIQAAYGKRMTNVLQCANGHKFQREEWVESRGAAVVDGATPPCPICGAKITSRFFFDPEKDKGLPIMAAAEKKAMITSDAELANNTHPADGNVGAPVLDGKLEHTERPNVNAVREALETQAEMEVGKPIAEKQQEIKEEKAEEKSVSVEKGSGTQIIINIAGKKAKTMTFSNEATAQAFIKSASEKFGDKVSFTTPPVRNEQGIPGAAERKPLLGELTSMKVGYSAMMNGYKVTRLKYNEWQAADAQGNVVAKGLAEDILFAINGKSKGASMNNKDAGFNMFFPGQVLEQFYPEIQHEIVDHPNPTENLTNSPMVNAPEVDGDAHIMDAVEAQLDPTIIAYVSTSPAAGAGIGRDGKSQVLEGAPLRKENDIRGPMFTEEFYTNYNAVPGEALNVLAKKAAAGDEKKQFANFLKKVLMEVAVTFLYAFKATSKMPFNKIPGIGEVQLDQVETAQVANAAFNINLGSRVKYLMDKLADNEIQDAINDAWAQAAVWNDSPDGGYVYEVFVRAETIDTDNLVLKYKFITGTKEAE